MRRILINCGNLLSKSIRNTSTFVTLYIFHLLRPQALILVPRNVNETVHSCCAILLIWWLDLDSVGANGAAQVTATRLYCQCARAWRDCNTAAVLSCYKSTARVHDSVYAPCVQCAQCQQPQPGIEWNVSGARLCWSRALGRASSRRDRRC